MQKKTVRWIVFDGFISWNTFYKITRHSVSFYKNCIWSWYVKLKNNLYIDTVLLLFSPILWRTNMSACNADVILMTPLIFEFVPIFFQLLNSEQFKYFLCRIIKKKLFQIHFVRKPFLHSFFILVSKIL